MMMSVSVNNETCRVIEEGWLLQGVLCQGAVLFIHFVMDPQDKVIESLKGRPLRDLEHELQRIDNIQAERLILLAHKIELEEFVAQVIPYFFKFRLQSGTLGVAPDLAADP